MSRKFRLSLQMRILSSSAINPSSLVKTMFMVTGGALRKEWGNKPGFEAVIKIGTAVITDEESSQ